MFTILTTAVTAAALSIAGAVAPPAEPQALRTAATTTVMESIDVPAVATRQAERLTPSAVIIGDSISASFQPVYERTLNACGFNAQVHAQGGRAAFFETDWLGEWIFSADSVIRSLRSQGYDPDLWVIEIGTNELWEPMDAISAEWTIHRLGGLLTGERVVWVDTNIDPSHKGYANSLIWNAALDTAGVEVVPWSSLGTSRLYDGIHPDAIGAQQLADLYCEHLPR